MNRPSLAYILPKLSVSHKDSVKKNIKRALDSCSIQQLNAIPSLEQAFEMLGKTHMKILFLSKIAGTIEHCLGQSFYDGWTQELLELKDSCIKQVELLEKMILGILQHKESDNALTTGDQN